MAHTVYLHLGTPKSGTTYVQAVLTANKDRLRDNDGLLFPGARWRDQVHGARDVLDAHPLGHSGNEFEGAWQQLVDEMDAWDGAAVISMEWLGSANPAQAQRIVSSLSHASQVEVVLTVRDLARTIPAAWQEFLQNWETWTWREFLDDISSDQPRSTPAGRLFWTQQDLGRMLAIWTDVVPADRIHLVTLPPPGAPTGVLWSRFAEVVGIDPHRYDSGGGNNESLGLESTEVMRRVNELTKREGMSWTVYDSRMKQGLAKRGLSQRKSRETAPTLPAEYHEWVVSRSEEQVAAIRAAEVHVVGDLADLVPAIRPAGPQPEDLDPDSLLDAAVAGLVFSAADHAAEVTRLRRRIARLEGREPAAASDPRPRTQQALVELSEKHPALMTARSGWRRLRRWTAQSPST